MNLSNNKCTNPPQLRPKNRTAMLAMTAFCLTAIQAAPLLAEEADETMDEVSVTASRVKEKVSETPVTIDIINEKELDVVKFTDSVDELLNRIPGNSLTRNLRIPIGGKNYTVNLVDGMAVNNFGGGTNGFIDESNTSDIERVEIIKGPASALYGSNALGGVINIITRKPPLEPEYKVWGEVGAYDRQRGGVSAAGTNEHFGYFVDANFLESDGWRDRRAKQRKAISGKIEKAIGLDSMLTVRAEYLDKFQENIGLLSKSEFDADWGQAGESDGYKDEQMLSVSAAYERSLDEKTEMKINYSIRSHDEEGHPTYRNNADISQETLLNQNIVATVQHDFDYKRSRLIAGVDLQHSSVDNLGYDDRTTSSNIDSSWDITAKVVSPFAQFEISPDDRLRITAATRYDNVSYKADDRINTGDQDLNFSNLTSKVGATLKISDETNFWIGYSEGFVVPSSSTLFTSTSVTANSALEPETAKNYELGFRSKFFKKRLTWETALYNTNGKKMIVDGSANSYVNAGEIRFRGVESSLAMKPVDYLRFDLAHTYSRNQIINYTDNGTDYSGNDLSSSPKNHLNARVTWTPIKNLDAELEWDRISSYYTHNDNTADPNGKESRPDLLNLRVSYKKGPWSFWAHGLNLTDEKYAERISYSTSWGGSRSYTTGRPLTVYSGLSYAF